jgi:hypothetical protein
MDTAAAGEDPEDVLESEVLTECSVEHVDRTLHEFPALDANGCSRAAGSDFVVVGHIDIDHEFFFLSFEGGLGDRGPDAVPLIRLPVRHPHLPEH